MMRIISAGLIVCMFSGCTYGLWERQYETVIRDAGTDNVYAFGVARETANGQLSPGSLAMMGEKYWYVIHRSDARNLPEILNAGLPERFRILDENNKELSALPVRVDNDDNRFSSSFCLQYPADGSVKNKLETLGFQQLKGGAYVHCFQTKGQLYTSPKQLAADYRFEAAVPVALSKTQLRPRGGVADTAAKILLTPAALAVDAVGAVTVYPVLLIALKSGGRTSILR